MLIPFPSIACCILTLSGVAAVFELEGLPRGCTRKRFSGMTSLVDMPGLLSAASHDNVRPARPVVVRLRKASTASITWLDFQSECCDVGVSGHFTPCPLLPSLPLPPQSTCRLKQSRLCIIRLNWE